MVISGISNKSKTAAVSASSNTSVKSAQKSSAPKKVSQKTSEDSYQEVDFSDNNGKSTSSKASSFGDLYKTRTNQEAAVRDAEENLDKVTVDENKKIDDAEKKYDNAVQKDEKVSKDLKEKETKINEKITEAESGIETATSAVKKIEGDISTSNSNILKLKSIIGNLNGYISNCKTDEEKAKYNSELKSRKSELSVEETKKAELEEEMGLQSGKIANLNHAIEAYKLDKSGIQAQIAKDCSKKTSDAKAELNKVRNSANTNIQKAQDKLNKAQNELKKTDDLIKNQKLNAADVAEGILGDNGYREWSDVAPEANSYDSKMSLVRGNWCAGFVTYAQSIANGGRENIPGNFNNECFNQNTCYGYAHWAKDNGILMDKREDEKSYDIKRVQPGDLILFNTTNDGTCIAANEGKNIDEWAHIGIVTGINEDGTVAYTIEGNTSVTDNGYYAGGTGVLAKKERKVNGGDFNGNCYGTSYILLSELEEKKADKK